MSLRQLIIGALLTGPIATIGAQVPVTPAAILVGDRAPKPAGPRTIAGIVVDTLANPVDSAEVFIASLQRRTLTGNDGAFRFENIDPGTYELAVRHVAHQPQSQTVTVDSAGGVAMFMLVPLARSLAPVVVLGDREPTPAGPRTLIGIVTDTSANPIDSVEIMIGSIRQRRTSNVDGAFHFEDIRPGTYELNARRFGYLPQTRTATVGRDGGVVKFALLPFVRPLPPVISSSTRGGLSGVVGDTAFNIVPGAEVSIVASDRRALTDSTGAFFIDVRPGKYMVRIKRAGFASRLFSVKVPNDSGRRIVVWLAPAGRGSGPLEEYRMYQLRERLAVRSGATSTFWTREDIANMPMTELTQLTTAGAGRPVADRCMAVVDGGPQTAPLWEIRASDIETLEVYPAGSLSLGGASRIRSARPTSIRSIGAPPAQWREPEGDCKGVQVFVWLRK